MVLALGMLFGFVVFFWLVFFKFKWLKLSVALGACQRVLRGACAPDFPDRAALHDAGLEQCQGRPAHHPVGPAPDRTDAGDGGAGRAKPARQERPAALPVRPPALTSTRCNNSKPSSRRRNKTCRSSRRTLTSPPSAEAARCGQDAESDVDLAQRVSKAKRRYVLSAETGAGPGRKGRRSRGEAQKWTAQMNVIQASVKEAQFEVERTRLSRIGDWRREHDGGARRPRQRRD